MLRKFRITLQILFFALFCVLFIGGFSTGLKFILRCNPYTVLITSLSSRSVVVPYLIIGGVVLVITIFMGKIFCGMFCPLGAMIDFFDWASRGRQKKAKQPYRPPYSLERLKYAVAIMLLVAALFGITFPLFMDPLSIAPTIFAVLLLPFMQFLPGQEAVPPVVANGGYLGSFTVFILMVVIFGGSIFDRRFWCQYICPTGAFLGIISRFSLLKRVVDPQRCVSCGVCQSRTCPTRAIIGDHYEKTFKGECILCGNCSADPRGCTRFVFAPPGSESVGANIERRTVVSGIFAGLFLTPTLLPGVSSRMRKMETPIRPPGAVDEAAFLSLCITCGACLRMCPENALHPCTMAQDGFLVWNTPKLVARKGYCLKDCIACSAVCPTGALVPITVEQKRERKVGTAMVDRSLCRPWRQQYPCMICAKKCPYGAIDTHVISDGNRTWEVPIVDRRKCVGCGMCEFFCPVQPEAAIRVSSSGEKRIKLARKKQAG